MNGSKLALIVLAATISLFGISNVVSARETVPAVPIAEPSFGADSTLDPALRALLVGIAASLLREAAASPDPMNALGETLQKRLASVLRSPEAARLIESLIAQAFKDAPTELREPLALFAQSMLKNMRRDLFEGGAIR